jgi:hypothetical protein
MSLVEIAPTDMIIVIGNNDGSDGDGLLGVMLVVWRSHWKDGGPWRSKISYVSS